MGLDYCAGDRQAQAGAVLAARLVAAVEGVEDTLAVGRRDALALVGDLDLDPAGAVARPDRDTAIGGGMANRVLDQVEEDALDLLGVGLRQHLVGGKIGRERDPARLGRRPHRGDGVVDQAAQLDLVHRPGDLPRLDPRELEEVVDQRRQRLDVGAHLAQVALAGLPRRHSIVDRLDQQPQRGEGRAQVVRDSGDHLPPRLLDLAVRTLLHRESDGKSRGERGAGEGQGDEDHLRHPHPVRHRDRRGAGEEGGDRDNGGAASRPQPVADSPDRLDEAGLGWVVVQLRAESTDVDGDGAGVVEGGVIPDGIHQLVARKDLAGVGCEVSEQVELTLGQRDLLAVKSDRSHRRVNPQRPDLDRRPPPPRPGGETRRITASTRATSSSGEKGLTT